MKPELADGIKFLTYLFENGHGFSLTACARFVFSNTLKYTTPIKGKEFGNFTLATKFMNGIFQLKPSLPKYSVVWDIKKLLPKTC